MSNWRQILNKHSWLQSKRMEEFFDSLSFINWRMEEDNKLLQTGIKPPELSNEEKKLLWDDFMKSKEEGRKPQREREINYILDTYNSIKDLPEGENKREKMKWFNYEKEKLIKKLGNNNLQSLSWEETQNNIFNIPENTFMFRGTNEIYNKRDQIYLTGKHMFFKRLGSCKVGRSYNFIYRLRNLQNFSAVLNKSGYEWITDKDIEYAKSLNVDAVISLYPNQRQGDIIFIKPVLLRVDEIIKKC